jgi:hypothetical protein
LGGAPSLPATPHAPPGGFPPNASQQINAQLGCGVIFFAKAWRELHAHAAAELAGGGGGAADDSGAPWEALLSRFMRKSGLRVHALPAATVLCRRQLETTPLAGPAELQALLQGGEAASR